MKKQNKHPNQCQSYQNYDKLQPHKKQKKSPTCTSTSTFKPRFIVKDTSTISCQDIHLQLPHHIKKQNENLSEVYDNSPSYTQTRSNSFRKNWKQQYENVSKELKVRTRKFNEIIDLCRNIMADVHSCTDLEDCHSENQCEERVLYMREKIQLLLNTFDMFRESE